MRPIRKFNIGEIIGNHGITYVSDSAYRKYGLQNTRYINVKCRCGHIFETQISPLLNGRTKSCGCLRIKSFVEMNTTHGMYGTHMYRTWRCMKDRTQNANIPNYERYGKRGIQVFPPWIHDFQLFLDYVSALPNYGKQGYTLDRINNDGNYEPGNLRWTTRHIQATNKKERQKNNTSGHTGIVKADNSWVAVIKIMGKNKYLGQFKTKEQAVRARNNYIIANGLFEYKIQEVR